MRSIWRFLNAHHHQRLWRICSRILNLGPWPARLPWGGWWLTRNDVMGMHMRVADGYERAEQRIFATLLAPGMVVVDVGAHHGLYTLLAARHVGSDGRVIAFEPSPREFARLRFHLRLNQARNVQLEKVALGDVDGSATLHVCLGQETGCNSLIAPAVGDSLATIEVPVCTLDAYVAKHDLPRIDMLKVDAEGAEKSIFRGADQVLTTVPRPIILVEVDDTRTQPWGYRSTEVYDALETRGYRWFCIGTNDRLAPCQRQQEFHENLFAIPVERVAASSRLAIMEVNQPCTASA